MSDQELYDQLVDLEVVSEVELAKAWQRRVEHGSFQRALVVTGTLSDQNVGQLIADYYDLPFVDLDRTPVDEVSLKLLPEEVSRSQQVVVYGQSDTMVQVVTADPTNLQIIDFIQKKTGKKVSLGYATQDMIEAAQGRYRQQLVVTFQDMIDSYIQQAKTAKPRDKGKAEPPIIKMVDTLFQYAYSSKASDIHIEPEEEETIVRFRVDGILHKKVTIPQNLHDQVITRIKVLAHLRTDEHQAAQDGKLRFKVEEESIDVRVSIVPVTHGERIVMRLLSEQSRQISLEDLGLQSNDLSKVREAYGHPHGMVLVTGPTGSGKTTTLYSMVKLLNNQDINIMTIEDPVEYDITGVNQIQVNKKTNLTFSEGLRSIVRQDPDVMLIGEIRDQETAGIAVNSAMTGHLVLSTLHTNDAATTIPRLLDMQVEPFLIASSVNVIIAQRLVRRICLRCRVSEDLSADEVLKRYGSEVAQKPNPVNPAPQQVDPSSPDQATESISSPDHDMVSDQELNLTALQKHLGTADHIRLYHGKGEDCQVCQGTGYKGRIGIFEVLEVNEGIQQAIVDQKDANDIQDLAVKSGMTTMLEDGLRKVEAGLTTLDEILRVTRG